MPHSSQGFWNTDSLREALAPAEHTDWWHAIRVGANQYGIDVELVIALGMRETRLRNMVGDSGHGFGPLQIDRRFHPILYDGSSIYRATGAELVFEGCRVWSEYRRIVQQAFPAYTVQQVSKVTCSAYNCGTRNAISGSREGDSDVHTTGKDYGAHVMAMAPVFLVLIGGKP